MTSEWNHSTINDVCVLVTDGSHSSPKSVNDGKYMVSVKDFTDYGFDFASCRMISNDDYETLKRNGCVPQIDDILIGKDGARFFEDIIIYHQREKPALLSSIAILRCDKSKILPDFLYYVLRTPSFRQDVKDNYGSGSAIPRIILKDFKRMMVSYPSLEKQQAIISVLTAIDSKIQANTEINDNLQQQAFSVFDNLIANAENNDCTVSDYAFLNPKRTLAKNQVSRSIDMSQLSTSGAFPSGWEMKPFNGGMRFTNGDTLLARITPCLENGKTAFIDFLDDGEVAFGSTEYIVLAPKNDTPPEMLYCLARYPAFVDYAVKNMNGSSGRQRVSAETVGQYRLPLFDKHSLVLFKEVVSPMFLKMRYNSLENMRLAELRDALLPKLMSSEINVSAVQL